MTPIFIGGSIVPPPVGTTASAVDNATMPVRSGRRTRTTSELAAVAKAAPL